MAKRSTKPTKAKSTLKGLSKFKQATAKFKGKLGTLRNQKTKPRVDPLWTLDQGVTYSLLSSFLNCRHRFHVKNIQGWRPKKFNFPLEFGNLFHLLIEAQDRGIPTDQIHRITDNYVRVKIDSKSDLDADTIKELAMMGSLVNVTHRQYVEHWERNHSFNLDVNGKQVLAFERDFDWISKEQPFEVQYQLPDGTDIKLRGKKDGVFRVQRKAEGNWLFETKTKGDIDVSGITQGLHKDMQTGMYLTAEWIQRNGVLPKGVLYNVIRRTQLKPRVNDTVKTFSERVEEDIISRPQFYFMRWTREVTPQELSDFQRHMLNPALFQLVTWWNSIKRNPMHPFETVIDDGILKDNPYHYERPFGAYDGMSHSQRGEFFEILTDDNYFMYEQSEFAFPELQDNGKEEYLQYFEGIK